MTNTASEAGTSTATMLKQISALATRGERQEKRNPLSDTAKRMRSIATQALEERLEYQGGVRLSPREIKEEVAAAARRLNIEPVEAAEIAQEILSKAFIETMTELDAIIYKNARGKKK